ncbi:MAG: ABC transporter ATP-binding protein [Acidobacteria bacterium]|nr:ABC transporter ATP-binding protein [Acidobacteriota bacterium]
MKGPAVSPAGGPETPTGLTLSGIRKSYDVGPVTTKVLKGVDLEVRQGDNLAIMGGSGSGKSTLMNIMGLMDRPSSGTYLFGGRDMAETGDDERSDFRNRRMGFVFQAFHLLPHLSAWRNVALPLVHRGTGGPESRSLAVEMLERVEMGDRIDHRPNQLSGGQQQRVGIARALVGGPAIVFADEPTAALDRDTGREIMNHLLRLNSEEGVTIVVITHDRDVARQCSRLVRLVDGVIEESDPKRTRNPGGPSG